MPNKMLIDATHPEETRVVVLRGNRVEEFDFESAHRKQLRGNIYLAKVTRVEPSLQAAFVDYGGNRHGFLAFSEIHPDYYQIPVADRQALIDEEQRAQREADAEADNHARRRAERTQAAEQRQERIAGDADDEAASPDDGPPMAAEGEPIAPPADLEEGEPPRADVVAVTAPEALALPAAETPIDLTQLQASSLQDTIPEQSAEPIPATTTIADPNGDAAIEADDDGTNVTEVPSAEASPEDEAVESVGGADAMEEVPERPYRPRRQYKIQEVIKRRQVMLVQVVKEERGTKGAALTTYLSLAGRYSVLMPNTARGGGISRKITDAQDRRRLKEVAQELEVPEGMGVILRTAGASRTKTEVKRDFEYLLRLWENVRDLTLKSSAPMLVYEEGSLIKRSIRDLYSKDIDEILVGGEEAYREARDFMRMLMPSHVRNVKPFRDTLPIFTRFGIEHQLDAMFQPVVQLRSGGYIVINQTEALVAIDVNSGRATREHHIEDTALKTNLEAADEIARQLRLRDLAGLVVIDFIDMDEKRNNRTVERRLKEALKQDRARIQVGHISHFGLLEMSRQRIRSSVLESSTDKCPQCGGTGHVRSVSSVSLQLLRSIEEMLLKGATHNIVVRTRTEIALYLLNNKRAHLRTLEERFRITITVNADPTIAGQTSYVIEKGEQVHSLEQAKAIAAQPIAAVPIVDEDADEEDGEFPDEEVAAQRGDADETAETSAQEPAEETAEGERERERDAGRTRRRRRRGRRGDELRENGFTHETVAEHAVVHASDDEVVAVPAEAEAGDDADEAREGGNGEERNGDGRRRRRGRRGGRRNRRGREGDAQRLTADDATELDAEAEPERAESEAEGKPAFDPREAAPAEADTRPPPAWQDEVPVTAAESAPPEPAAPFSRAAPQAQTAAEAPAEGPPVNAPATEAPGPRRRSTVREPAPAALSGTSDAMPTAPPPVPLTPAELPQPVVTSPPGEEAAEQPRRSGWWRRR
ncbi:MAG: Rne/Rng family ribonuclease [Hyphomicrobiales bacterium]|nr:Rne/Rng family ribonuclease [Hyphomicrobiales bacterium]